MKKTLLLFICFLTIAQIGFSQISVTSISYNENITSIGSDINTEFYVTNNSTTESIIVDWSRVVSFPDASWQSVVCTNGLCYAPNTNSNSFTLAPGATMDVKITTTPNSQTESSIAITFKDANDETNMEIVTINYNAITVSVENIDFTQIKVYPNPTIDFFKLTNSTEIEYLEVYNLIGKKMKSYFNVNNHSTFNVQDLPKGMYLVRMLDKNSEVLTTKRINKR